MDAVFQLFISISLWCGEPINSTLGATGFKTGTERSTQNVQQCRIKLLDCLDMATTMNTKRRCFIEKVLQ